MSEIELTPPQPVAVVEKQEAEGMVPLTAEQKDGLDLKVIEFVNVVISADVNSQEFKDRTASVLSMGDDKIKQAASMSNRMLQRPINALNNGVMDDNSTIGKSLLDLRSTVEGLDPSKQGDLFGWEKWLGFIPIGKKLTNYFRKYQSSQTHINAIIEALYNGQDELRRDNAAIEQERAQLWETMQFLEQYVYIGKQIDSEIESRIMSIESGDPNRAKVLKEDILFYVRQKVQDLLTQLAVSIQGYLALDLIKKNNIELIKGVDRATTTTVSALRTAVIVAQALANQKLVLDQINALNATTSDMIAGTASMLKQQAGQIQEQASSATIDLDKLKAAFSDIYETMDVMADYKVKALDSMQETVNVLSEEVDKSQAYIDRVREDDAKTPANQDALALS